MEYNLILLVGLAIIFIARFYSYKWFIPTLPMIYMVLSGLLVMTFPRILNPYFLPSETQSALFALSNMSAMSLTFTVIVWMARREWLRFILPILVMINSFLVIANPAHWGLGLVSTFDASLIAMMYPMALYWSGRVFSYSLSPRYFNWLMAPFVLIPPIAIFVTGSSVGIGALCLGLFIVFARKHISYLMIPIVLCIIAVITVPHLFSDSGRFEAWNWSMHWWCENANHWFGTGLGTYRILGPFIQILGKHQVGNWFVEMHNDWLQCLFEFGFVGLFIASSVFLSALYKVRNHPHLCAAVVTYGAVAMFYYPTHSLVGAVYGVMLLKEIIYIN